MYPEVEEAIPLDSISMEHIYAEIEEYKDDPPVVPPRADTPIMGARGVAPDYPPYSSVQASQKKSRKPSLNIDGGLPRFHQGDSLVFSTNLSSSSSDAMF